MNMLQYPHIIPAAAPSFANIGSYPNLGWGGVNMAHLTAMQAQTMTRNQKQQEVQLEINKLR